MDTEFIFKNGATGSPITLSSVPVGVIYLHQGWGRLRYGRNHKSKFVKNEENNFFPFSFPNSKTLYLVSAIWQPVLTNEM